MADPEKNGRAFLPSIRSVDDPIPKPPLGVQNPANNPELGDIWTSDPGGWKAYGNGMAGASRSAARDKYDRIQAQAALETDPQRKVALLDQAEAELDYEEELYQKHFGAQDPEALAATQQVVQPVPFQPGQEAPQLGEPMQPATQPGPGLGGGMLSLGEFRGLYNQGGGGNPRAAAAAAAERDAATRTSRQAGIGAENAMEERGELLQQGGHALGDIQAQAGTDYAALLEQQAGRKAKEAEDRDRIKQRQASAQTDLEAEEAAQQHSVLASMSDGQRIAAAIAIGLGQFGAGLTGGRNLAFDITQAAIGHEVEARKTRLRANGDVVDNYDRLYLRALDESGSTAAADAQLQAAFWKGVEGKLDEHAARLGGEDAKAQAAISKEQMTAERTRLEAAAADAAWKRAQPKGGTPFTTQLNDYLKYMKAHKDATDASGVNDHLEADARKRLNLYNVAEEQLLQYDSMLQKMEAEGRESLPGYERTFQEPGKLATRYFRQVTGASGSGTTGLTPDEEAAVTLGKGVGISSYFAEKGNSANLGPEREQAEREMLGNGTVASARANVQRKLEMVHNGREAVLRKHLPPTVLEYRNRHIQNPAQAATGPQGAVAAPAGATAVGRVPTR